VLGASCKLLTRGGPRTVERKSDTTATDDPIAMGRHWLELNKLRPRVRRAVDTKASKGAWMGRRPGA
jgi:hypothetical protein